MSGNVLSSLCALFYLLTIVTNKAGAFVYLHVMGTEMGSERWIVSLGVMSMIAELRYEPSLSDAYASDLLACIPPQLGRFSIRTHGKVSKQSQQAESHTSWSQKKKIHQHSGFHSFVVLQPLSRPNILPCSTRQMTESPCLPPSLFLLFFPHLLSFMVSTAPWLVFMAFSLLCICTSLLLHLSAGIWILCCFLPVIFP